MKHELRLRIVVTEPLPGVWFALQRGKSELVAPTSSGEELTFDFSVLADLASDPPRLTGAFTQGPPATRFVYINSGTYAGQTGTDWSRRAKVPLIGIRTPIAAKVVASNSILQVRVHGMARDGGPLCASVPLLTDWEINVSS
jgi:Family of unknown function (DUF5990)